MNYGLYNRLDELSNDFLQKNRIWIDIPAGLASATTKREVDRSLRRELGPKSSSVFTPPIREALEAKTKAEAKSINKKITGKSLSEQTLNITPKIAELDQFIQNNPTADICESHPEYGFKILNHGKDLTTKKGKPEGFEQRLNLLNTHLHKSRALIDSILRAERRKDVKKDDILDAACLAVCNYLAGYSQIDSLDNPQEFPMDDKTIPIKIAFYNFTP